MGMDKMKIRMVGPAEGGGEKDKPPHERGAPKFPIEEKPSGDGGDKRGSGKEIGGPGKDRG